MTDFDDAYRVYSGTRLREHEWCDLSCHPQILGELVEYSNKQGILPTARDCMDSTGGNAYVALQDSLAYYFNSVIAGGSAGP